MGDKHPSGFAELGNRGLVDTCVVKFMFKPMDHGSWQKLCWPRLLNDLLLSVHAVVATADEKRNDTFLSVKNPKWGPL